MQKTNNTTFQVHKMFNNLLKLIIIILWTKLNTDCVFST